MIRRGIRLLLIGLTGGLILGAGSPPRAVTFNGRVFDPEGHPAGAATVFVRNLYCRFLCPVGAALGLLSNLTVFRIKRWKECNTCKICEKACEWGAIQGPKIIKSECVRCDDCERIYADTATCVHWVILKKKSNAAAVPLP